MKQIFLHIGHFKTGSTAIQQHLLQNESKISRLGYHYVKTGRPSLPHPHHLQILLPELLLYEAGLGGPAWIAGYAVGTDGHTLYGDLKKELAGVAEPNIIISAEPFIRLAALAQKFPVDLFRDTFTGYTVSVIVYLRRQDEYLESLFNQMIKQGNHIDLENLHKVRVETFHYDYEAALAPWIKTFGSENVIVKLYQKRMNVVDDFCQTVGLPAPGAGRRISNPALPNSWVKAKNRVNALGLVTWQNGLINERIRKVRPKPPRSSLLTVAEREAILEKARAGNEFLRATYFPDQEAIFAPLVRDEHPPVTECSSRDSDNLFAYGNRIKQAGAVSEFGYRLIAWVRRKLFRNN